jgi:hypothetical protein
MVAMFDIMGRLYQIEAKVLPGGNEFELTRFQQSLVFERDVSNRSGDVGLSPTGKRRLLTAHAWNRPRCETSRHARGAIRYR